MRKGLKSDGGFTDMRAVWVTLLLVMLMLSIVQGFQFSLKQGFFDSSWIAVVVTSLLLWVFAYIINYRLFLDKPGLDEWSQYRKFVRWENAGLEVIFTVLYMLWGTTFTGHKMSVSSFFLVLFLVIIGFVLLDLTVRRWFETDKFVKRRYETMLSLREKPKKASFFDKFDKFEADKLDGVNPLFLFIFYFLLMFVISLIMVTPLYFLFTWVMYLSAPSRLVGYPLDLAKYGAFLYVMLTAIIMTGFWTQMEFEFIEDVSK